MKAPCFLSELWKNEEKDEFCLISLHSLWTEKILYGLDHISFSRKELVKEQPVKTEHEVLFEISTKHFSQAEGMRGKDQALDFSSGL